MTEDYRAGLAGKRVFVTGASGFIGHRLVAYLTEAAAEVTVLVRTKASARGLKNPKVSVVIGGMADGGLLEAEGLNRFPSTWITLSTRFLKMANWTLRGWHFHNRNRPTQRPR